MIQFLYLSNDHQKSWGKGIKFMNGYIWLVHSF